jgi:chloramphenicol O-acetyltransferase type A
MRPIDMERWPRGEHFEFYGAFDHPHFGMCADLDLTRFQAVRKSHGYSMTVAIVYVLSRASNAIPEFRYRIRGRQVVEHEVVHPSITILGIGRSSVSARSIISRISGISPRGPWR